MLWTGASCGRPAATPAAGPTSVAVNIGARQFQHTDFSARLIALIAEVGVAPKQIELELLEGTIIEDFGRASATMEALRADGVRIALDDFGTGYSSLSYLQKLPLDKLKLDKSMVEGVNNLKAAAIVQAVTALSRALGLKVVAEGVETKEQQRFLRISGCHYLQGYLFSPAIGPDLVDEPLRQRWPRQEPGERPQAHCVSRVRSRRGRRRPEPGCWWRSNWC